MYIYGNADFLPVNELAPFKKAESPMQKPNNYPKK